MRALCIVIFFAVNATCFAQEEATFRVSKKKKVYIECQFDTLVGNTFYYFKAYGVSTKEIIPGKFSGGEVWLNDTAVCIHTAANTSSTKKYLLELFLKKNTNEIFSRSFTIVPKQKAGEFNPGLMRLINREPDIFIYNASYQGVYNWGKDSIEIKLKNLLERLSPISMSHSKITLKLKTSFECDGVKQDFFCSSLTLTSEIKERVKGIKSGCSIILNIDYHSFNDPPEDLPAGPYKILVK